MVYTPEPLNCFWSITKYGNEGNKKNQKYEAETHICLCLKLAWISSCLEFSTNGSKLFSPRQMLVLVEKEKIFQRRENRLESFRSSKQVLLCSKQICAHAHSPYQWNSSDLECWALMFLEIDIWWRSANILNVSATTEHFDFIK